MGEGPSGWPPVVLLSNREPYEHMRTSHGIEVRRPPGGLVSALDPTVRRTHGVWVAWGSGTADREAADADGRLAVPPPPAKPSYVLRRVWLDDADVDGYYLGFANSVLWPLCHLLIHHLQFRDEEWARYEIVNRRFAAAAREEVDATRRRTSRRADRLDPGLSPRARRRHVAAGRAGPFHSPASGTFRFRPRKCCSSYPTASWSRCCAGCWVTTCWQFHTERYAVNFLECAAQLLPGASVDRASLTVRYDGRTTALGGVSDQHRRAPIRGAGVVGSGYGACRCVATAVRAGGTSARDQRGPRRLHQGDRRAAARTRCVVGAVRRSFGHASRC